VLFGDRLNEIEAQWGEAIDEFYVNAGRKGRERDGESRSRGLSTRGRGTHAADKPPVFILADRATAKRYVIPAKAATESAIRLLLAVRQQESLTVYHSVDLEQMRRETLTASPRAPSPPSAPDPTSC
jgi:hypothetical protein